MKKIHYFPADIPVSGFREAYCAKAGYQLVPFSTEEEADVQVILLHLPVEVATDTCMSPEMVWKKYFSIRQPQVKIIQVTSYGPEIAVNLWRWYAPPGDVETYLKTCLPVTQWQPVETHALHPEELWKRFWDGHDDNGFGRHFANAKHSVGVASDRLNEDEHALEEVIQYLESDQVPLRLEICCQRWDHYYAYWKSLPFWTKFEEINARIPSFSLILPEQPQTETILHQLLFLKKQLTATDEAIEAIVPYFTSKSFRFPPGNQYLR